MRKNRISLLSVESFLAQSAEAFLCRTLRYIRKVRLSKNFMPKRVISLFPVEFFFTYTAHKVRWGNPLCFRIFRTSKTSMLSRGHRNFPLVFFGLPVLKHFVGNTFNFTENFGYRNFLCMRTENHVLRSKFFASPYAKRFWERLLRFNMFGISETFFAYHGFPSIFLSHSSKKLRQEPSNVSDSFKCVSKKLMQKNGVSRLSVEKFLSQSAEKFRWGTLRYIRKVQLSKNFMPKRVISLLSVEFLSRLLPMNLAGGHLCDS